MIHRGRNLLLMKHVALDLYSQSSTNGSAVLTRFNRVGWPSWTHSTYKDNGSYRLPADVKIYAMFGDQAGIRGQIGHIGLLLAMYPASVGTIFDVEFMWEHRLNLGCQART